MKLSYLALSLFALSATPSFAGVLALESSGKQIDGKDISKGGKMTIAGRTTNLITMGAGVRSRFSLFKVYVGELLVNDNRAYQCDATKALESLKNLNGIAMRLQFERSIGMSDLKKAFEDGFDNNNVDANNAAIKEFMAAVAAGGDIPNGSTLEFAGEKVGSDEVVTYVAANGTAKSVKGGAGFVRSIFALWLGDTGSDGGLKALRDNLVTCKLPQ